MEFQLKEGWFDYLISGFFFGTFIMLVVMIYSFGSTSGFPYDTYLLVIFVDFVCFIVTFVFHILHRSWFDFKLAFFMPYP